jgi:hypothetical protein
MRHASLVQVRKCAVAALTMYRGRAGNLTTISAAEAEALFPLILGALQAALQSAAHATRGERRALEGFIDHCTAVQWPALSQSLGDTAASLVGARVSAAQCATVLAVIQQSLRMRSLAARDTVLNVQTATLCLLAGAPHHAAHLLAAGVCAVLQVSGAASRQLVVPHRGGTRLGVWSRPPAQSDHLVEGEAGHRCCVPTAAPRCPS